MFWRRAMYYVALDRFKELRDGGGSNFKVCFTKEHALQVFKKNPKYGQIDVRGRGIKPYCWKYWNKGRVITQQPRRKR
jgi:hypothetical protein